MARTKKTVVNLLRILLCGVALWIVAQGVTIHDHVMLASGEDLVGSLRETEDSLLLQLRDGSIRTVSLSEVSLDEGGNPRINYGLSTAWHNSRKFLLLLALAIFFPVVFPQALRFQWLLRAQSIHVSFWKCVKLSFAGNFLNFATPLGSNMGDLFKAYFVSQHTPHKTEAVATVALDRVVGLGSLLFVAAAITAFSPSNSRLAMLRPYMLGMFGAGVAVVAVYLSPVLRRFVVPRSLLARLPMLEQLQRVDRAARVLAGKQATLVGAILLTIFLQGLAIGAFFTVAVALRLRADASNVLEYYTYFYTGVLVQTLPGPPQGLGTVELAYRYFFADYGSASQIVCMAFAIRLVALGCALPGFLVTLTGSYKPRNVSAPPDSADAPCPDPQSQTDTVPT